MLSFFEDAVLVRGPLWVLGNGGPRNLKVFTAATVFFRRVVRRLLQKSWLGSAPGCSNHTRGQALLHHIYMQALSDEADDH